MSEREDSDEPEPEPEARDAFEIVEDGERTGHVRLTDDHVQVTYEGTNPMVRDLVTSTADITDRQWANVPDSDQYLSVTKKTEVSAETQFKSIRQFLSTLDVVRDV